MNKRRRTTYKKDCKKNGNKMYELAKKVEKNSRFFNELRICTDYQWSDPISGQYGITKIMGTRTWYAWGLTDIDQWSPCLRIDQNVIASAKTHILRAQLNCRVDICDTTQVSYINVFRVSFRKEATNAINITNEVSIRIILRILI